MSRLRVVLLLFALVGLCSPWVEGQDKPRDREPAPRMRGQLPQNWGKLGLTDEQKQKVYKVQNEFRPKIEALQRQISELRDQERKELETVLTADQKKRLREIVAGRVPSETKPNNDAKTKEKP
jgi:Spy/CpxP family protein refolding chaperone